MVRRIGKPISHAIAMWNGGEYKLSPVGPAAQELVLAGGLDALTRARLKGRAGE